MQVLQSWYAAIPMFQHRCYSCNTTYCKACLLAILSVRVYKCIMTRIMTCVHVLAGVECLQIEDAHHRRPVGRRRGGVVVGMIARHMIAYQSFAFLLQGVCCIVLGEHITKIKIGRGGQLLVCYMALRPGFVCSLYLLWLLWLLFGLARWLEVLRRSHRNRKQIASDRRRKV